MIRVIVKKSPDGIGFECDAETPGQPPVGRSLDPLRAFGMWAYLNRESLGIGEIIGHLWEDPETVSHHKQCMELEGRINRR